MGTEQAEVLFRGQIGEADLVAGKALRRGQASPRFALPSATGAIVSLGEQLSHGPVIVTFYRGGWCPYCNIALRALQSRLPQSGTLRRPKRSSEPDFDSRGALCVDLPPSRKMAPPSTV